MPAGGYAHEPAKAPAPGPLELVQAFINTLDLEEGLERLDSPAALGAWLRGRGLLDDRAQPTPADVRRARELREALRALLPRGAKEPRHPTSGRVVDDAARRAGLAVRFDPSGQSRLEPAARGVPGALGRILAALATAQSEGTWARLKACANPGCAWAFYDRTKNRSGAWCEMATCGNRAKARAFRARH